MSDIGMFYASSTGNCQTVAMLISKEFSPFTVDVFDVMHTTGEIMIPYKFLIFGIPTWDKYRIHEDWKGILPTIPYSQLGNKKIAMYGLGDQKIFPDNFADGLGLLYTIFAKSNAKIIGSWPASGYNFRRSLALRKDHFIGLVLDEDIQMELTPGRVKEWVKSLKQELLYEQ
jgi:flavodoxin I